MHCLRKSKGFHYCILFHLSLYRRHQTTLRRQILRELEARLLETIVSIVRGFTLGIVREVWVSRVHDRSGGVDGPALLAGPVL